MESEKISGIVVYGSYIISIIYGLLAFPLAFNMVTPNSWYGVRTQSTLQNPDVWYSVNNTAGWGLLLASFVCVAVIYYFNNFVSLSTDNKIIVSTMAPIFVPIIVLTIAFLLFR